MEAWRQELYHYGIKGMKWGVRRTPEELGHFKEKNYKFDVKSSGDIILKRGSTVRRVSRSSKSDHDGYMYASFTPKDIAHYQRTMTGYFYELMSSDDVKTYDLTFKVKKDLVIPSERKKIETFLDLMKNQEVHSEAVQAWEKRVIHIEQDSFRFEMLSEELKSSGMPENIATLYAAFSFGLYSSDKLRKEFFGKLKASGYDAIFDTEDLFVEAEAPIIIFGRDKVAFVKSREIPEATFEWQDEMEQLEEDASPSSITRFNRKI